MTKLLSLEELKKNSSGNSVKKQNAYKGSTPLLSLDELKNNEGPSVETASIGNTVEVYNKYKQAKATKPSGMVGPAGGIMTERKIELPVTPLSAKKQVTPSLPTFRDDAHRNLYKNSLQTQAKGYEQEVNKHLTGWRANAITTDPKLTEANKKLSDVRKQLEQIGKLEQAETYGQKYLDGQYDDNFVGQTKANYAVGRMGQDSSMAWNAYLNNPTEANRKYAERIDEVMQKFRDANAETLADDATLPWLSQSFAQYVPQWMDQAGAGIAGAIGGGVVGSVVPVAGTLSGARAGAVAATGMQSYDLMRGAAFKSLIDAGVDEETALRAANDEALISSLVEMGDTAVDIMTLGSLSALKGGIAGAFKTAAGDSAKKKAVLALANYGINIGSEGLEEAVQEAVSIGNARRIANGDMSLNGLVGSSVDVAGDAITGRDAAARESIFGAAKEGAKISAVMAGADAVVSRTGEAFRKYYEAKHGASEREGRAVAGATEQEAGTTPDAVQKAYDGVAEEKVANDTPVTATQPTEAAAMSEQEQKAAESRKSALNQFFYKNGQDAFEAEFQKTGKVDHFSAFRTYYNAGLSGVKIDDIRQTVYTEVADRDMLLKAYEAGAMDSKADLEARMANESKLPRVSGVYGETEALNSGKKLYTEAMAEAFGVRVKVEKTMVQNGYYDPNERQITMAADAETYSGTISHEVGHFIRDIVPENFSEIRGMVMTQLNKMDGKSVDQRLYEYDLKLNYDEEGNRTDAYDNDALIEEMVCDGLQAVVMSEKDARELFSKMEQQSPGLLQKLKDFLTDLLNKLRGLIEDEMYKEIALDLKKDEEFVSRLRDKVAEAAIAVKAKDAQAKTGGTELSHTEDRAIRHSVRSMADAAGLEAKKNPMTGVVSFELNGKPVEEVTAEHIRDNSGLGALIRVAEKAGNITKAEAEIQYKSMAEIMNMIISTQDPDLVWAWVGSSLFSAVKTNSDPQYGTTIDFTTVCRKTQDMITAMSKAMIKLGRGLTTEEVTELQQKLIAEDSAVPCPVCYVFSRWAGVGSILDNMRRWQEKYDGYSEERLQDRIAELTEKLGKGKTKDLRKMLKEQDERYFELEREKEAGAYRKKKLKEARKTADAVGKASIDEQIKVIDERAKKIKKELDRIKSSAAPELSWLLNVRTNPGYAKEGKVPNNILFNLDGAATFSEMYPLAWKYRSTRGPGAGKAILPYSDMRLGDMILGVKNNSAKGSNLFANAKGELNKEQAAAVEKATTRTKAQNLIGGQRFQSTSDFRYDYALDYLLAFMECQALGSKIQTYTKIIEYVDMIAAVGGDVNMSVMPKDKGYVETEDGKKLIFSSVTGIDFEAANAANEMHDNAQLILVGINDEHIRLALDDFGNTNGEHIGFVIPYHASGASINEFIRVLVGNLGEEFRLENYVDYSDVQTDSERKNATPDQKRRALIRKGILQGRLSGKRWTPGEEELKLIRGKSVDISDRSFEDLRAIEQKALRGDKAAIKEYESWSAGVLWDVYNKLWVNKDHPDFGVRLSSAQAGPVMPHEYWNKGVNREKAYVNGFIFRSYCYSLGLAPRFTGAGAKGKAHGDFSGSKGYWKTLIDRPMYNNDGTYRDQQKVNVSKFQKEMLTEDYAEANWGDYKVQEPDAKRAERAADKFVAEKQGAKFSMREKDAEYMAAVEAGDMVAAQKMVDAAAEEAMPNSVVRNLNGKLLKVYHGSPVVFNEFRGRLGNGIRRNYFSPWANFSAEYGEYVRAFYIDLRNPIEYDYDFEVINDVEEGEEDGFIWCHEDILEQSDPDNLLQGDTEFVVYDANRIKSADPVVYDDRGEVIPLSQRFNMESKDIRYSVRESGEAELRRENASLMSENKHLQKMVDNLKHQFELTDGTTPDQKSVRRVAKAWLKQIESKADLDDFSVKLGKITEYFAKAESKNDREHAMAALRVLVRDAMEQAETLNTEMRDEYSGLIKQIRNTSLEVTDELRSELENYGGYNTIRRENFGRMNLSAKGKTSIDNFYYDLCQEHPEFFREEDAADEAEQLMNIIAVLDTLKPVAENPYGYDIEEYVYDETMGLLDKMAGIQMEQTFADKKEAKNTAALKKLKDEFNAERKKMRDEIKAAQEEAKKYLAEADELWYEAHKARGEERAKYLRLKKRNKENADRRKARADRKIIEKEAKAMLEWLANPTDTKHVPEALKKHTAYLLTMFTTGKDDRLTNLQLVVSKLAEEYRKLDPDDKRNEDMTGRYIEYDDNLTLIAEALEDSLKKRTDGLISLNDLTAEEMRDLKDMIRMLKKTLMEANKLLTMEKKAEVSKVSTDIITDMQPRKGAMQTGKLRVMNDFFKLDMLDANSFFKRMSKTAHATIYRSFRKGLDTKIRCVKEAADFMGKLVDKKTVKKWRDSAPEKIELMGGTVYLNIPQIMSVYCLSRREQGKQHLYTGGVVGDTNYHKKRLNKETLEAMKQVTGSQLTEADVKMITDRLTAEQKQVAREMQKFLSENAAEWGNDVTMQLFGYKKFNEKNYFPIKVDGDTTMVTVGKPKDATRSLRSLGMTKQLKKHAQNPVMARDIFEVFAEHIDQMSSYAAFVPAISDTNKILNYKTEGGSSVKKELRRVMGDGGIGYIHKLVDMINGAVAYSNDGAFAKAMVRNMKIASVGFNARVVAQQPASIVRASAVIDPQYIAVTAIPTKKDWELIYRYAPISWWKEQGYYDTNIGRSIESLMTGSSGMERVTDASMWAAGKADKFTWGWMWKACEKQIRAKQPELSGEAFYEAVGELFSRAIDDTQVVDSPLHRSQKMREKGLFTQMTTSFMSEPTKTYNMATTAMLNLMRENTPENRKQLARSLWWLTASAAATAAMAGIVDAGRDDDDDEKWADKWLAAFAGDYSEAETMGDKAKAFFGSNFGSSVNPMNYIPYMKDLMSIFDGYDIRRTDMDWAVDIKNAMNRLHKYAEGDSEYTAYATFTYVAGAFSKVFGVPAKSIMRDIESTVNWFNIHLIGTEEAKYENAARNLAVGSKKNMSYYTDRYMRAYQNGDKVLAQKIYSDMIKGGISKEDLDKKITDNTNTMMFDAHVAGNSSEFRNFWRVQNGRGKEDADLKKSMKGRYETMYKNAVNAGDSTAMKQAKAGFMEFGGKEETLNKYH